MKTSGKKASIVATMSCIFAAVCFCGCVSADRKAWDDAQQKGTQIAFETFIKEYPDSQFSSDAKSQISIIQEAETFKKNWALLKKGMTVQEVAKLLNGRYLSASSLLQGHASFLKNTKESSFTSGNFTYTMNLDNGCLFYELEFSQTELVSWKPTTF